MTKYPVRVPRLYADFNGYFGDVLCLSHSNESRTEDGRVVTLKEGMIVTAYDEDVDDQGKRDYLFATGVVRPSRPSLACRGSVWMLEIDANGLRHESDLTQSHS
jgi:hypothetical protein